MMSPLRTHQIRNFLHRTPWVVVVLAGFSSCSPTHPSREKIVVDRLQSGAVVDAISRDIQATQPGASAPGTNAAPSTAPTGAPADELPTREACESVPNPDEKSSDETKLAALDALARCMIAEKREADTYFEGLDFLRKLSLESGEAPLHLRGASGIAAYLTEIKDMESDRTLRAALESRRRSFFRDEELEDLQELARLRREAMVRLEDALVPAMRKRRVLTDWAAQGSIRWRLMAVLRDLHGIDEGRVTARRMAQILRAARMTAPEDKDLPAVSGSLHPYALAALIPDDRGSGSSVAMLLPEENPFFYARRVIGNLGGSPDVVSTTIGAYKELRDLDNFPIPAHERAQASAVRVALLDTGVDYRKYPELGEFLGQGGESELTQKDFADRDLNSYVPAVDRLAHGSGVLASLLTILSHHQPEMLLSRKLDLAIWKIDSVRQSLSGPVGQEVLWNTDVPFGDVVIQNVEALRLKPQIVSVSLEVSIGASLEVADRFDALARAPWLWVMAAGNNGLTLAQSRRILPAACLSDISSQYRKSDHILCVGALKRGILEDQIASYSNYGEEVDLFVQESFSGLCTSGTSCATPAVSAVAAAIAESYPKLTVPEIRQAILRAARWKQLSVEPDSRAMAERRAELGSLLGALTLPLSSGAVSERRQVLVFDPQADFGRALSEAERIDQASRQ